MDPARAQLAISLVDLTNLNDSCGADDIVLLCERAASAGAAAVCVWPDFVAQASSLLTDVPVAVATVVDFPTGTERAHAVGVVTRQALADGADEIDVVLPYRAFAAGDTDRAAAVLDTVRRLTLDHALMKVILETGEAPDDDTITRATQFAIRHGADFVKSSTGKTAVSATPHALELMLAAIADTDRVVGVKPSGGIGSADDAEVFLALAEGFMGTDYLHPSTFRFGASGVLDALLQAASGDGATSAAVDGY